MRPLRALSGQSHAASRHPSSEIGFTEAGYSLVHTRRIKNREIKLDRLTEPAPQIGVIAQVIERERVNQDAEPRVGQFCFHKGKQLLVKVYLELRRDVRPSLVIPQFSDKEQSGKRIIRTRCSQLSLKAGS